MPATAVQPQRRRRGALAERHRVLSRLRGLRQGEESCCCVDAEHLLLCDSDHDDDDDDDDDDSSLQSCVEVSQRLSQNRLLFLIC